MNYILLCCTFFQCHRLKKCVKISASALAYHQDDECQMNVTVFRLMENVEKCRGSSPRCDIQVVAPILFKECETFTYHGSNSIFNIL